MERRSSPELLWEDSAVGNKTLRCLQSSCKTFSCRANACEQALYLRTRSRQTVIVFINTRLINVESRRGDTLSTSAAVIFWSNAVDPVVGIDLSRASPADLALRSVPSAFLTCHFRPQEDVSRGEGRCTWFGASRYVHPATGIRAGRSAQVTCNFIYNSTDSQFAKTIIREN